MPESLCTLYSEQQAKLGSRYDQTRVLLFQVRRNLLAQGCTERPPVETEFELASRIGLGSALRRHIPGKATTGRWGSPVVDWVLHSNPYRARALQVLEGTVFQVTLMQIDPYMENLLNPLILWFMDLPASESHHHAHPYGLLDHSLEVALLVLAECIPRLMPQDCERRLYNQALRLSVALSLVHDIGKLLNVEVKDKKSGETWNPMREPLAYFKARHELPILEPTEFRFRPGRGLNGHEQKGRNLLPILLHPKIWRSMGRKISKSYEAYTGRYETPTPARPAPLDFIADCVHRADGASAARSRTKGSKPGHYLQELVSDAERIGWDV